MLRKIRFIQVLAVIILLSGCQAEQDSPLILISRKSNTAIMDWLTHSDSTITGIDMYNIPADSIAHYLGMADGIVISGGPDVNPALYGKESELDRCGKIDYRRDMLEIRMIGYAVENNIPLVCICRGHQILNVFHHGSLIIDIPTDHDTLISHKQEGKHPVRILEGTMLHEILGESKGMVNSRHHQAVDSLAPGFRAAAIAPDGIIEAIEPIDPSAHPFILGVQWHPESMVSDPDSVFSYPIADSFIEAVYENKR